MRKTRWFVGIGVVIVSILIVGLVNKASSSSSQNEEEVEKIRQALSAHKWVRTTNTGIEEHLTLAEEGRFSYYTPASGNAVGDFDLYEHYEVVITDTVTLSIPSIEKGFPTVRFTNVQVEGDTLTFDYDGESLTFQADDLMA